MSWDPCTTEYQPWLHIIECHPATMSLAQAIAALMAFAAAIAVPVYIRHLEETSEARNYKRRMIEILKSMMSTLQEMARIMHDLRTQVRPDIAEFQKLVVVLKAQVTAFDSNRLDHLLPVPYETRVIHLRSQVAWFSKEIFEQAFHYPEPDCFEKISDSATKLHGELFEAHMAIDPEAARLSNWSAPK